MLVRGSSRLSVCVYMALVQLPTFSLLALVAIAVAEDHNSASWQIKAYGSAAPDFLAASATISDGEASHTPALPVHASPLCSPPLVRIR